MKKHNYNYRKPTTFIPIGIGERLDRALEEQNVNMSDLAKDVGVDRKTIYRMIENGGSVRFDTVIKIANRLNISIDWLVYGKEK